MDISWTTVFSSVIASGVFSGLFACILGAHLQRRNNKELEAYKAEVRKSTDEHQIQFKNLYEEKAKAIKILYNNFTELSRNMQHLVSCEKKDDRSDTAIKEKTKAIQTLTSITQKSFNDWLGLCLYLSNEDNTAIMRFFKLIDDFSELYDPSINNFPDTRAEQGKIIFSRVINHLNVLRVQFRETLNIQDEIDDNINKKEVK